MTEIRPLDFKQVEAVRVHMLLTMHQMAELLGVSRVTYYNWVQGRPPRPQRTRDAKRILKAMLEVIVSQSWPSPLVIAMDKDARMAELREQLTLR